MKKEISALVYVCLSFVIFISCNGNSVISIPNSKEGKLHGDKELVEYGEKVLTLDSVSAPKPIYMQIIQEGGEDVLTILNTYNSSVYFYNYDSGEFIKRVSFKQVRENEIRKPGAYYILNEDSVYILDMAKMNVSLLNLNTNNLLDIISLKGSEGRDWPNKLPQYNLFTANPIQDIGENIVLTGQLFWSVPSDVIKTFHFSAYINKKSGVVQFYHCYPEELYGQDANWEGGLQTTPYTTISPKGDIVVSYPPSHDIYLYSPYTNGYTKSYGGSNYAGTISSIGYSNKREIPKNMIYANFVQQDMYGPIIYDKYREVYYRIMTKKVADSQNNYSIQDKNIYIVIMDEEFHYIGETIIGNGKRWNINNTLVTKEGLNIEYISSENAEEEYIIFKVFKLK